MYVEREILGKFEKLRKVSNIIALVGARQAGKTTFLKEHMRGIKSSYLMFDDPDIRGLFEDDVKKFERQHIEGNEVAVLDEVQYCRDAGAKLKYLAEKGHRLWVTSSSEIILGKDILSYLVGRVSILKMYPFSLAEFLAAKSRKAVNPAILRGCVWEHMLYGGYPKVVITEDFETKSLMLNDLYETMILKDIARVFSIEDMKSLEDFSKYISVNLGGIMSYETASKSIGISFQTLKKYLDAMEKSYLITRVPPFFTNRSKEITKRPKVYFVDTGLRNAVARGFPAEPDGRLFENYVLSELKKSGFSPKYWRTKSGAEVDFVIEKDGETIPIEAKLSAQPGKVERGLRSFIEQYKPKKAILVNYRGLNSKTRIGNCTIMLMDVLGMEKILSK